MTNERNAGQSEAVFEAGWLSCHWFLGGLVSALGEGWMDGGAVKRDALMLGRYVHMAIEGK